MEIAYTECVAVTDATSVGEARRTAMTLAHRLEFDETRSGEFVLLASEVSRNVLVHGGGGQIVIAGTRSDSHKQGRIIALDKGPGIADLTRAMDDGFSTAGTMGGGLGAMRRIASDFEIFTGKHGTVVLLEMGSGAEHVSSSSLKIAGLALPYPGEKVCGDGWAYHVSEDRIITMLVDGLGHGWGASEAAQEAIATFRRYHDLAPAQILANVHDALRKTRGAVAAIAEIRPANRRLTYAGIGNIAATVMIGGSSRSLVSLNGTLGATVSRIQDFQFEWSPGNLLVLHSDGIQTRWDLATYAGLVSRHPAVIGGVLIRDFRRSRDDASVVVIKG